jgi:hypothetical protein
MRVLLPKAIGSMAAVFRPMIPSARKSIDNPVANAISMHIGVLIDSGMHRIIAGSIDNVTRGVNWK